VFSYIDIWTCYYYESVQFKALWDLTYQKDKNKLEIWGKAQRESARRPKSDWGTNLDG